MGIGFAKEIGVGGGLGEDDSLAEKVVTNVLLKEATVRYRG